MPTIYMINPAFDFSAFFNISPDLVCIAGKDGYFKNVNPAVIERLGYSEAELFARPISSFIYEEDRELTHNRRQELLKGTALQNFVNRYIAKSGELVWLHWTSVYFPDREIVFAIAKDVTERKKAELQTEENYKKFKGLATHFKSSIEKDRKFLAYELHEQLAQLISALKMNVEWIAINEPGLSVDSSSRIADAVTVSKLLIQTIQRLAFSLSPNMLDDFGLDATMEWLCNEFAILHGIPCVFESDYDEKSLSKEMQIDFFRICQESLTTVLNRGACSSLLIRIEESGGSIHLIIRDDGKGFDMDDQEQLKSLAGIRERVASINGGLTVTNESNSGTGILVSVER